MAVSTSYMFDTDEDTENRRRRRRQSIADLLMQSADAKPIQSPWQGAAKMASSGISGLLLGMEEKRDREMAESRNAYGSKLSEELAGLGGGGSGGSPVTAALAGKPMGGPIKLGGFEPTLGRTLEFEGGVNPRDTNGTPSVHGINQKANPDVDLERVKTDPAYRAEIYRQRYWNTIDGDKLDPRVAHVAFDTSVIAGPGKARELLKASGGDPEKFLALREAFQNRLLAANPEKYGPYAKAWANRTATLRADVGVGGGGQPGGMMAVGGGAGDTTLAGGDTLQGRGMPDANRLMQIATDRNAPPEIRERAKLILQSMPKPRDPLEEEARSIQVQKGRLELDRMRNPQAPPPPEAIRKLEAVGIDQPTMKEAISNPQHPLHGLVTKAISGGGVTVNNAVNTADPIKLTAEQAKDQSYLKRAERLIPRLEKQDEALLDGLSATGGRIPLVGNYLKTPEYRQAENTAREILAIILRKDTGAAVTDQEMSQYSWIYLPQPGDDKDTIIQKRDGRKNAIEGIRRGLGGIDIILDQREALLERQKAAAQPGTSVPAPTAKGAPKGPPAGVSPAEWKAMTDEERALWK
jgi:hypothetical protein